jgi:hypothetical protein
MDDEAGFDDGVDEEEFLEEDDDVALGSRGQPHPRKRIRLRRSPMGVRAVDVRDQLDAIGTELDDRRDDIDELRNDVAALWLAFGQHERALRDLISAVEALGGARVAWPGDHGHGHQLPFQAESLPGVPPPRDPFDPPGSQIDRETIASQLAGLDDVLAAIDQATRSLESVYGDAARGKPAADPAPTPDAPPTQERS